MGLLTGPVALTAIAAIESVIGITLTTVQFVRTGLTLLGVAVVGILSPVTLFIGDLFPEGVPTLEAQYVLKDIVLAAAGLVVAASVLGSRL